MAERIIEPVKTGALERLQPWQALFGILTYVIGAFDVSEWQVLVLCGLLVLALGFTQRTNYKHKEAIKEVVAPWVMEKLLKMLEEYIPAPAEPVPPTPDPASEIAELKAKLEEIQHG